MVEKILCALFIKLIPKGGKIMMAMFFAQRVILGKADFTSTDPSRAIPDLLKKRVADVLLESGLVELVPKDLGGTA